MKTFDEFEISFAKKDGRCVHDWKIYSHNSSVKKEASRTFKCKNCFASIDVGYVVDPPVVDNPVTGTVETLIDYTVKKRLDIRLYSEIDSQDIGVSATDVDNPDEHSAYAEAKYKDLALPSAATKYALCEAIDKATEEK